MVQYLIQLLSNENHHPVDLMILMSDVYYLDFRVFLPFRALNLKWLNCSFSFFQSVKYKLGHNLEHMDLQHTKFYKVDSFSSPDN